MVEASWSCSCFESKLAIYLGESQHKSIPAYLLSNCTRAFEICGYLATVPFQFTRGMSQIVFGMTQLCLACVICKIIVPMFGFWALWIIWGWFCPTWFSWIGIYIWNCFNSGILILIFKNRILGRSKKIIRNTK